MNDRDPHSPRVGESTEEIPVVRGEMPQEFSRAPEVTDLAGAPGDAAPGSSWQEAPGTKPGALPPPGTLAGLRFNGRRLLHALVLLVWAAALVAIALIGYTQLRELTTDIPRWSLYVTAVVLSGVAVVALADVDEPDVVGPGTDSDFHELDWSRKQLYAVRPRDVAWVVVELFPLIVYLAALRTL